MSDHETETSTPFLAGPEHRVRHIIGLFASILACCKLTREPTIRPLGRLICAGLGALLTPLLVIAASPPDGTLPGIGETVLRGVGHSGGQSAVRVEQKLGTWRIRHSKNPSGSFVLLRNDSSIALSFAYWGIAAAVLGPSETTTRNCSSGGPGRTLVVGTDQGEIIHSVSVECGDAVQVSLAEPPTASPAGSSVGHASFALTVGDERWQVSHTKNANGMLIVIRNASGHISIATDGGAPTFLPPGSTTAWSCDGSDRAGAMIEAKTEKDYLLYSAYIECGDVLAVTRAGN